MFLHPRGFVRNHQALSWISPIRLFVRVASSNIQSILPFITTYPSLYLMKSFIMYVYITTFGMPLRLSSLAFVKSSQPPTGSKIGGLALMISSDFCIWAVRQQQHENNETHWENVWRAWWDNRELHLMFNERTISSIQPGEGAPGGCGS